MWKRNKKDQSKYTTKGLVYNITVDNLVGTTDFMYIWRSCCHVLSLIKGNCYAGRVVIRL